MTRWKNATKSERLPKKKAIKKIKPTLVQASSEYIANYVRKGIGRGGDNEGVPLERPRDADSLFKNYIDGQAWALHPLHKVSNDNLADAIAEVAEEGKRTLQTSYASFCQGLQLQQEIPKAMDHKGRSCRSVG